MSNAVAIKTMAWQCVDCGKKYISRIKADLCCDVECTKDEEVKA
jgi:hypothetical protein